MMLQILVATFAQLISFRLALTDGYPEYLGSVGTQRQPRADFTCTTAGSFPNPANCSQYYVCLTISPGNLYLSYMTCPNALVFDPVSQYCTTTENYACPSETTTPTTTTTTTTNPPTVCESSGFYCNSDTNFTLCAGGIILLNNTACPEGFFCNNKCVAPCIDSVPSC
jgi:hypothetical protein